MIPDFDGHGYLPPGIYPASLDEVEARFAGGSEIRRAEMESLRWLVELAKKAGVRRLVINGSFVTNVVEPNDVDCALLTGADFPRDRAAEDELRRGLPFLGTDLLEQEDFDRLVDVVFATDQHQVAKGMVEVIL
jgi:hypothetical protein